MYGNALYGSALYGSNGSHTLQFLVSPAKSDAQAMPYDIKQTVSVAIALSESQAHVVSIDAVWIVGVARADSQALVVEIAPTGSAYFDPALSESLATANPIAYQGFFDLSAAQSEFRSVVPSWVNIIDTAKAGSTFGANRFDWQLYMDASKAGSNFESNTISNLTSLNAAIAKSEASSKAISWFLLFDTVTAKAELVAGTVGYTVSGLVYFDPFIPNANASSNLIQFQYAPVVEIPDPIVTRSGDKLSALINVRNPIPTYNLTLFRTDNHIGSSEEIISVPVTSLPYTDPDLIDTANYRYVAAYALPGNIGGVPVLQTGNESSPRITIGKNRSLT